MTRAIPVNMRDTKDVDIRIDRATMWGNPYTHLFHVADSRDDVELVESRSEAILKYSHHLLRELVVGRISLSQLANLHGKRLGCWCAPLSCHGDVLAEMAEAAYYRINSRE